jgi:hypothetical protein
MMCRSLLHKTCVAHSLVCVRARDDEPTQPNDSLIEAVDIVHSARRDSASGYG